MDQTTAADLLRACAAGRREYAAGCTGDNRAILAMREALLAEAVTLETAARIVEGDTGPLYGLLPSWRWTDEMNAAIR